MKINKEYIERRALLNEIEEIRPLNWTDTEAEITEQADFDWFENLVKSQPTADVQEVRHGKWIEKPYLLGTSNFCSLCGENYGMPHGKYKFCPNCGAKMDKE